MTHKTKTSVEKAWDLAGDQKKIRAYYRDWADRYDDDVEAESYHSVDSMLDPVFKALPQHWPKHDLQSLRILDAGCGTGLIGKGLYKRGYSCIDGFDLSPDMIEQARAKHCYRSLFSDIDLSKSLSKQLPELNYDVVVCVGVLTLGHVPPSGINQLIEAARTNGLIGFSARDAYAQQHDIVSLCSRLQRQGVVKVVYQKLGKLIGDAKGLFTVLHKL